MELIIDLGIIFIAAAVFGMGVKYLRLPLVVGYILAGVVLGQSVLGIITDSEIIENLSTLGIALMLFLAGIELSVSRIRDFALPGLAIGVGQVVITGFLGYLLGLSAGLPHLSSIFLALALTFSSTIMVVKLLDDKREINALYAKIAIGVLLIQDGVAILALMFLYGSASVASLGILVSLFLALGKACLLAVIVYFFKKYMLDYIFGKMARSTELLLVASIGWAFVMSLTSYIFGFGMEIGAFLAGLTLASLPYNLEISSQIKSVRNFFMTLFFVTLGLSVTLDIAAVKPGQIIWLILFVLVLKTVVIMTIMGYLGYRKRTSFQTAITLAQVSEFSFVLIGLGVAKGHISYIFADHFILAGVLTLIFSAILIENSDAVYSRIQKYLKIFERSRAPFGDDKISAPDNLNNHVIIFGADHIGKRVLEELEKQRHLQILVIDFNPDIVKNLQKSSITAMYGDMGDPEFISALGLETASLVISTTHDHQDNLALVKRLTKINQNVCIYMMANNPAEAIELYRAGAERVILPSGLTSDLFSELVKNFNKSDRFNIQKHIKDLKIQQKKYFNVL